MKIKTGDMVRVIAGKNKGKTGKVVQVLASIEKVVVEGVNPSVKHVKKRGNQPGQRVSFNAPLHLSNVRVVGKTGEGRVGYKLLKQDTKTTKVRILRTKKGQEDLE